MDGNQIFEKTDVGREAIRSSTPQLDFKARAALIMVDGVQSAVVLSERIARARLSEHGLQLIEQLQNAGLIAPKIRAAIEKK